MTKVLIIDDETLIKALLVQYLGPCGFEFHQVRNANNARQGIEEFEPDLVLLDLHFSNKDDFVDRTTGGRLYETLRKEFPDLAVVIFSTRPGNVNIRDEEFNPLPLATVDKPNFSQPGWAEELIVDLTQALDKHHNTAEKLSTELGFIVGGTPAMLEFARRLKKAARTDDRLLIRGETGTGKTLAAEAAHRLSGRSGPFVTIRPGGLPSGSVAAELAASFAKAEGGTLYLDEAEDLSDEAKAAMLGLLDSPPGDVRIITSIGSAPVAGDGLRGDLVARLRRGQELTLPPLRERLDDIPELFDRAVTAYNTHSAHKVRPTLKPLLLDKLKGHGYPGNIREFEAILLQALASTANKTLKPVDVDFGPPPAGEAKAPAIGPDQLANYKFAELGRIPPGQARWKAFIKLGELLKPVTDLILKEIRAHINRYEVADDFTRYFYGPAPTQQNHEAVRGFLNKHTLWRKREK